MSKRKMIENSHEFWKERTRIGADFSDEKIIEIIQKRIDEGERVDLRHMLPVNGATAVVTHGGYSDFPLQVLVSGRYHLCDWEGMSVSSSGRDKTQYIDIEESLMEEHREDHY